MKTKIATLLLVFLFPFLKEDKVEPPLQKINYPRTPTILANLDYAIQGGAVVLVKDDTLNYKVLLTNGDTLMDYNFNQTKLMIPFDRFEKIGTHQIIVLNQDSGQIFSKNFELLEYKTDTSKWPASKTKNDNLVKSKKALNKIYDSDNTNLSLPDTIGLPLDSMFITSKFGKVRMYGARSTYHHGTDYRAKIGTKVKSVTDGIVIGILSFDQAPSFGGTIVISCGGEIKAVYMHLSKILVMVGDTVRIGETIGLTGNTGSAKLKPFPHVDPHLHFALVIWRTPTNLDHIRKIFEGKKYKVYRIDRPRRAIFAGFFLCQNNAKLPV